MNIPSEAGTTTSTQKKNDKTPSRQLEALMYVSYWRVFIRRLSSIKSVIPPLGYLWTKTMFLRSISSREKWHSLLTRGSSGHWLLSLDWSTQNAQKMKVYFHCFNVCCCDVNVLRNQDGKKERRCFLWIETGRQERKMNEVRINDVLLYERRCGS